MTKKKILQISTYDFFKPNHGGKLRCFALNKFLKKKFNVRVLAFEPGAKDLMAPTLITLNHDSFNTRPGRLYTFDVNLMDVLNEKPKILSGIIDLIANFEPDLIMIEQPYGWPIANAYLEKTKKSTPLLYSSHNIEIELKKSFYSKLLGKQAPEFLKKVRKIEEMAIKSACKVIAVSEQDAKFIRRLTSSEVRVYPNGHNFKKSVTTIDKTSNRTVFSFIGSAHPPNVEGFFKYIFPAIPKLKKNQKIQIIGSVGDSIQKDTRWRKTGEKYELHFYGTVSEKKLSNLLKKTDCFLLPIHLGGGSNLKTAEALLSLKSIIATNVAFRGFEDLKRSNGVSLTDTPFGFQKAITSFKRSNNLLREYSEVAQFTWGEILKDLNSFISEALAK